MSSEPTRLLPEREITRGVIAIYKDYLGRGPSDAWTLISDDLVVVTVTGSMIKAETQLVESGQPQLVREMRRQMQHTMREDIMGLIERTTGKTVHSFLSDHDATADKAIEVALFS